MLKNSLHKLKRGFFIFHFSFFAFHLSSAQASQPGSQPTNMLFTNVKAYSMVMSFTATTADGYLVLKSSRVISDVPVDGVTYEKGQGLNSCKVMYVGANNIHNVREILEGTKYYFKVFAYNGTGNAINYLQTNPLSDSVTSTPSNPGNYYALIDSSSGNFVNDLHTLINNHTMVAYVSYRYNIVPAIFERDTVGGQAVVNCEYSNETTIYTPPFDFVVLDYSREHVLCKSWMRTYSLWGSGVTDYPEGADYYNLLLTRLGNVNSLRSNNSLGIPVTGVQNYNEFTYGFDANGNKVYAPKPNRRGDAARAMFYEMICYNGLSGNWGFDNLLSLAGEQSQNVLKQWNQQDPPDKFERTKNEYIGFIQQNRNPFIDHPAWVECINFDSLVKTNLCGTISSVNDEESAISLKLFPNPVTEILSVELSGDEFGEGQISVYDIYGKEILKQETGNQKSEINLKSFMDGIYLLKISVNGTKACRKFYVQHSL